MDTITFSASSTSLRRHDHIDVVVLPPGEAAVEGERQGRTLEGNEGDRPGGQRRRQPVKLTRQGQRLQEMMLAKALEIGLRRFSGTVSQDNSPRHVREGGADAMAGGEAL